ncbi:aldo/keto reductase [Agrococcus versicolor]|uniref:Aldo/keto reductase n=1 Tax=Agrococcus versicolor TaxID=501482 RepID=A0ABP5MKK3_9MICO
MSTAASSSTHADALVPPRIPLADGGWLSTVSLGTWKLDHEAARAAVAASILAGYRQVDTAARYHNELGVGQGIRDAGLADGEVQVTTKVRGGDQGYEETLRAVESSRRILGLDRIDLCLVHWPLPRLDRYVDTWRALVRLREDGVVASIGVSNFSLEQIDRLEAETGVLPVVDQVELHPRLPQAALRAGLAGRGVVAQAWGPLGRGKGLLDAEPLVAAARAHGVTPAQVALRWLVEIGAPPVPKSGDPDRRLANLDVFGFALTPDEHAAIATLETGERAGKDPATDEEF